MTELQGVRRFNFRHHRQGTPLGAERPQIKMRTYYEMKYQTRYIQWDANTSVIISTPSYRPVAQHVGGETPPSPPRRMASRSKFNVASPERADGG